MKSRLVLPFWYRLTWVVPEKGPLNGCVYVGRIARNESVRPIAVDDAVAWTGLCVGHTDQLCDSG